MNGLLDRLEEASIATLRILPGRTVTVSRPDEKDVTGIMSSIGGKYEVHGKSGTVTFRKGDVASLEITSDTEARVVLKEQVMDTLLDRLEEGLGFDRKKKTPNESAHLKAEWAKFKDSAFELAQAMRRRGASERDVKLLTDIRRGGGKWKKITDILARPVGAKSVK